MSKATELADELKHYRQGEVSDLLRKQDEAIKLALEALELAADTTERGLLANEFKKAIAKLREVQG